MTNQFIVLNVLAGKISRKDLDAYENEMKAYQREVQDAQRMSLSEPEPPEEPHIEIKYKKQWFNVLDMTIHSWYNEWDEEEDHEMIIVEYTCSLGPRTIEIKSTTSEWMEILNKLNSTFING